MADLSPGPTEARSIELGVVPAHVPRDLVRDFDFYDGPEFRHCPHQSLLHLRDGPDIFYTPRNGGHWVITRFADAGDLLKDPATFSSDPTVSGATTHVSTLKRLPLDLDPPEHTAYRRALNPMFAPAAVQDMEPAIKRFAEELVDSVADRGGCEFVSQIAQRYPTEIFLGLLGIPLDRRDTFVGWVDEAVRAQDPAVGREAYRRIGDHVRSVLDERRLAPGDDLLSRLLAARVDGRTLGEEELIGVAIVLFIGGLDTVVALLSFILQFLATHPGHVSELHASPETLDRAIEELIRRHGITNLFRYVTHDTTFRDVAMKAGDRTLILYTILGLDDRNVADPLTVDFGRQVGRHMTFGGGAHRCLGSHLARVELRTFLRVWLARIPQFRVAAGADLRHRGGKVIQPISLPLEWDVAH